MKTKIQTAINNINRQIDYIDNNPDYFDGFYEMIANDIEYRQPLFKKYLANVLANNGQEKLSSNDDFLTYVQEQCITYDDDYFKLTHGRYAYIELYDDDICVFLDSEQEIEVGELLTDDDAQIVADATDTIIDNSDKQYAYYSGHYSVVGTFNKAYFIECLPYFIEEYCI